VYRIFQGEIASCIEGGTTRRPTPDDSRRVDLGAPKLCSVDVDQADVLVGVPQADLRPRQELGRLERVLFGSVDASVFSRRDRMSSFLTSGPGLYRSALSADGALADEPDGRSGRS
jgi:hypothetical protein